MRPKLQGGEFGSCGEPAGRPLPEHLTLVLVPSLAALLTKARELNGAALTEKQVLAPRWLKGHGRRPRRRSAVEEKCGYADIDAASAWQSWLQPPENQS